MTAHEHEFANGRCGICAATGYTPDELEQIRADIDVLSRAALTPMPKEEPMTAAERRSASLRLLLPHPNVWTITEAQEAENCSGYCTVRYEAGMRVVDVPRPCPAHGRAAA